MKIVLMFFILFAGLGCFKLRDDCAEKCKLEQAESYRHECVRLGGNGNYRETAICPHGSCTRSLICDINGKSESAFYLFNLYQCERSCVNG